MAEKIISTSNMDLLLICPRTANIYRDEFKIMHGFQTNLMPETI